MNSFNRTPRTLIEAHRFSLGLTQKELAHRSGVGLRTLSNVEAGNECRRLTQARLMVGLGLSHDRVSRYFHPGGWALAGVTIDE